MAAFALTQVDWKPCWRLIPSRFPPVDLFARVAPPDEWRALAELETYTNERVRQDSGSVLYFPEADPKQSSLITAPFTHPHPSGDFLSDGSFGVCHTFPTFDQARDFAIMRRERFLMSTKERPMEVQVRVLNMDLEGQLHDFRGPRSELLHDLGKSQEIGRSLRDQGSSGVIYNLENTENGEGASIFDPLLLDNCRQERHLSFRWDGHRISSYYDFSSGEKVEV